MNFLSHYYFERYSHDPELVVGSILPDLVKNADRDINVLPQKFEERLGGNPKVLSIYKGWIRHIEADKYFHNSPFFYAHTHSLKTLLAPAVEGTTIRPSFLSHIALELLLDHLLLDNELVHEFDFYRYLSLADHEMIHRFLKLCEVPDTEFFFSYFSSFMAARYVGSYRDFPQITAAMINICGRLWEFELTDMQTKGITAALTGYTSELREVFHTIFESIQKELPQSV